MLVCEAANEPEMPTPEEVGIGRARRNTCRANWSADQPETYLRARFRQRRIGKNQSSVEEARIVRVSRCQIEDFGGEEEENGNYLIGDPRIKLPKHKSQNRMFNNCTSLHQDRLENRDCHNRIDEDNSLSFNQEFSLDANERLYLQNPGEQVRWLKLANDEDRNLVYKDRTSKSPIADRSIRFLNKNHSFIGTKKHHHNLLSLILSHITLSLLLLSLISSLSLINLKSAPSPRSASHSCQSPVLAAHGYQLTNNLIASNLPPKFITSSQQQQLGGSNSEIVVRVKEGPGSIGKLIYTLRGEDSDDDPITFGVLGSMASDLLRIENVPKNQANVYLKKELDRETTESYQVVITLTDGKLGRGNWITKSMLIIVEDVNDNYPIFGPHRTSISVREDSKWPAIIETIEATDQDEGRFGQVVYRLENQKSDEQGKVTAGSTGDVFAIETIDGKGVISLVGNLDYESKSLYQLRVLAIDRATESERLTTSTSILITVEDCEDQPPMFTYVPSITRIPENLPVGSSVVRVTAIDGDRGVNNPIEYQLISVNGHESGAEKQFFSIDSRTGLVRVAQELDREWNPGNENSFSRQKMVSAISNQPASFLLQIRALEKQQAGALYKQDADDSVTTELTVILTDVNDEPPTFNKQIYYGEILENSPPESLVSFVLNPSSLIVGHQQHQISLDAGAFAKVIDRDQGANGTFSLHLEGESAGLFEVWPREATNEANLMIKIAKSSAPLTSDSNDRHHQDSVAQSSSTNVLSWLDYEKHKQFQFNLVAREINANNGRAQPFESVAQMIVFVKDTNDNYPQFQSDIYKVEVPENAIHGMHICTVRATDPDSGIYGTAGIRYTEIRGEKANKFSLDPNSGIITLKTSHHGFDRESVAQFNLIVEARDSNGVGNRNTTQLLIIITDVNDQKPKFVLDHYEAFIYENELEFQNPPLQVQAIDLDSPNSLNSRITYSIVDGDPQSNFTIDPQTGRIRVKSQLILSPSSSTSNHSSNSLKLNHMQHLNEIEPANSTGNSLIALSSSGLDFESIAQKRDETRQFNLTIKATDSGLPEPMSDYTNVIIIVYDKNDHAPVFTRSVYAKSMREDAREGSHVIQVLALDGDQSPTNSKISYRISSGAGDKFVIDSDSGLISVASGANLDIDRASGVGGQKRTNYVLSVLALDGSFGANQKSASCLVNITIIDVNNKAPEFMVSKSSNAHSPSSQASNSNTNNNNNQQVFYINEDAPYGLIVTRVLATDLDSNSDLRYSINYARSEARNEDMMLVEPALFKDAFSIDQLDGTIKVVRPLDRELFDQVKLRLQVEDIAAETSEQIANTHLIIRITDVNDNRPTFKQPLYKAVVNENSMVGTSVITLSADDRDLNKSLRYSLDGLPEMLRLIRVNPRSGEITVNDKIDRELFNQINVTVRAEDSGHPHSLMGSTHLLISVRDENDNNPTFMANPSRGNGINRMQMLANPTLESSSVPPSPNRPNHRSSPQNNAWLDHATNAQNIPRFRSLSNADSPAGNSDADSTNSAHDPLAASGSAATESSAINNLPNLPFLAPGATVKVSEDSPVGMQIAYVYAEDADVENNGRVTYMLDPFSSGGKFRIDRDTGVISVAGALDREQVKSYSLIIEASDNYDLGYSTGESRRTFTQVNVQVTDVNDNPPFITTNFQPIKQAANAPQTTERGNELGPASGSSARNGRRASSNQARFAGLPSHEDLMVSSGPYDVPMPDCLFINEFQALNEPILVITANDLDDPSLGNAQIDLSIVTNPSILESNQQQLFSLNTIDQSMPKMRTIAPQNPDTSTRPPTTTTIITNEVPTEIPMMNNGFAIATDSSASSLPENGAATGEETLISTSSTNTITNARPKARFTRQTIRNNNQLDDDSSPSSFINTYRSPHQNPPTSHPQQNLQPNNQQVAATSVTVPEVGEAKAYLVVSQSLMEKVGNYSILVKASDRGLPPAGPLSSLKVINICVLDINNHAPVFHRPPLNHTIRMMENATIGTFVTQVEASDADHGLNGEVQYSLKPTNMQNANNDWQAFKIDRISGVISTAKLFNRQVKKYYMLRVQAQDFGKPTSLKSDIDINIMIVNSGQYQPEFASQHQSVNFTENLSPGIEWHTIISTNNLDDDPALINPSTNDIGKSGHPQSVGSANNWPQSSPCYFIVDGDDHDQVFHLDRYSHKLTNQKTIDREKKANYTLLIQASNNCQQVVPSYRSPTSLSSSQSSQAQPSTTSPMASVSTTITTLNSMQPSKSDDSIRSKRSTSITNRQLTSSPAKAKLVSQSGRPDPAYAPLVSGSTSPTVNYDHLLANDKSLLKLFIKINDVNDNAPKFTQRIYTGGITTEADFGTTFMLVQAVDPDAEINGQVTYSIVRPIKRFLQTSSSSIINNIDQPAQNQSQVASSKPSQASASTPGSSGRRKRAANVNGITKQVNSAVSFDDHQQNHNHSTSPAPKTPASINHSFMIDQSQSQNELDLPSSMDSDDLFIINAQTGEISLNFDPQRNMKGYFEFEVMANDTDGLSDSSMVFIYLLRQDQRVKFVLRLTPQELRQRLDKFRNVFGNITGAIVNIDSYKYFENLDGTVDKKKTSLYLHFVNPDDNTIIEVDKVLTLIDNNIEYLDELYKEFHVLSSEAAHLPLTGSALVDPIDQVRTGLLGVASFLALILILVVALCLNQRTRYERQLKAASVSAFGSSPLHLDPDFHQQTNLPNTNLHSQEPNPIWMNGFAMKQHNDWLASNGGARTKNDGSGQNKDANGQHDHLDDRQMSPAQRNELKSRGSRHGSGGVIALGIETDGLDYLSSASPSETSSSGSAGVGRLSCDLNSLGAGSSPSNNHHHHHHHHYNGATTATPRTDSLNSSQLHHCEAASSSSTNSGSASTTNERQALCHNNNNKSSMGNSRKLINGNGNPISNETRAKQHEASQQIINNCPNPTSPTGATNMLSNMNNNKIINNHLKSVINRGASLMSAANNTDHKSNKNSNDTGEQLGTNVAVAKSKRSQNNNNNNHHNHNTATNSTLSHHSTFGAFKEVTIYTDHQQHQPSAGSGNLVRLIRTGESSKMGAYTNDSHHSPAAPAPPPPMPQTTTTTTQSSNFSQQHSELSRVNKLASHFNAQHLATKQAAAAAAASAVAQQHHHLEQQLKQQQQSSHHQQIYISSSSSNNGNPQQKRIVVHGNGLEVGQQNSGAAAPKDPHENNLNKLSILNLETTEL